MQLGAFSISLTVKDIQKSKAFYEGLGFSDMGGSGEDGWVILRACRVYLGSFDGAKQFTRQGASRSAMRCIGQAAQR